MRRIFILSLIIAGSAFLSQGTHQPQTASAKLVTIQNRSLSYQVVTHASTVGEALTEQGFQNSAAGPDPLFQGAILRVALPVTVRIVDGGNESTYTSNANTVADLLYEQKIGLASTDKISPSLGTYLADKLKITIDRIVDVEVLETNEIPYDIRIQHNPYEYYGREKILTPGSPGRKEQKFLITYKNGVEIKRKLLSQKILNQPVAETKEFGTRVEVQDTKEGRASWYAYKGCMCAASPFYPKGRYMRVTSLATKKSIIVRINDVGPELDKFPDRVADLDSVAFKTFASLGAGTILVKVELLRN